MNFDVETDTLEHAIISAVGHAGYACATRSGKTLHLALIDDEGNVVESGPAVAKEAWDVCIQVQHNFWIGKGYLRVMSDPIPLNSKKAA